MTSQQWLTTRQVAERIQRSEEYVTRQCVAGTLKARKLGNGWRIKPEWLDTFMEPASDAAKGSVEPDRLTTKQKRALAKRGAA